jgi:microcystin degradation protein MlrC
MRAAVGGINHESSTYASAWIGEVPLSDFGVHPADAVVEAFTGTNTTIGGFLAACRHDGVTVVPMPHARAEPAGAVSPAAYTVLKADLLAALPADVDLILLDLHGAGVVAPDLSLEWDLLAAVRAVVGRTPVIGLSLDLHANVPEQICDLADVVVGFREYPHVDMAERATRAGGLAIAAARRRHSAPRIATRILRVPMVLPPSPTDGGAAANLRDLAIAEAAMADKVLETTVFHGFPYADTPQCGVSVASVHDGAEAAADVVNARIARWLTDHRDEFLPTPLTPTAAVALATTGPPVVIGDAADNPGGGASGDGTYLLRALLDSGVRACFATLHDPDAVAAAGAAGVGAELEVALGGRHGRMSGDPIVARARVCALTDGVVVHQAVRKGLRLEFGPCAWLRVGVVDLIVASRRRQVFDPAILALHGIDPSNYPVVAVKSAFHFRAGFGHLTDRLVAADSPGLTTRTVETLVPDGPAGRLWPMNGTTQAERDDDEEAAP